MGKNIHHSISYWEKEHWYRPYDLIIVGGGIVGLTSAIFCRKMCPEWRILIVERNAPPLGASTKNAGFACFGSATEILNDLEHSDESSVVESIAMRWSGLKLLLSLIDAGSMDYYNFGGSEIFSTQDEYAHCEGKADYLNEIFARATGQSRILQSRRQDFSDRFYHRILFNPYESQLNPVLMVKALMSKARSMGVEIQSGYSIHNISGSPGAFKVDNDSGLALNSRKVLLATNAFTRRLIPDLDIVPARNQVLVTQPIDHLPIRGCYHYNGGYVYFRNIGSRILLGGGRNVDLTAEETDEFGSNEKVYQYLKSFLDDLLPNLSPLQIEYQWSGIITTSDNKRPVLKEIEPGLFVAARLGGMGVAIGSLVGKRAAEMVSARPNI